MTGDEWQVMYLGLKADVAKVDGRIDMLAVTLLAAVKGLADQLSAHDVVLADIVDRLERIEGRP